MVAVARLGHIDHIACTGGERNIPLYGFAAGAWLDRDPRGINPDHTVAKQERERCCGRAPFQFLSRVAGSDYPGRQREAGRACHPGTGFFDATLLQQGL